MTSFKNVDSAISYPPEFFEPSLEGYVNFLLTDQDNLRNI